MRDLLWLPLVVVLWASAVLWADIGLRRTIKRRMKHQWSGWLITDVIVNGTLEQNGTIMNIQKIESVEKIITPLKWWKCILPWPGKKRWAETVLTKVALLGATLEYQAVSAWDWDEAWVIEVDEDNIIASSNKVATALAYLSHRGVPEA